MITKLIAKYYDLLRKENKICSRKDYWTFAFITFFINVILIFIIYLKFSLFLKYIIMA